MSPVAERLMALYAAGHTKSGLQEAGVASVWTQNNILNGACVGRDVTERILSYGGGRASMGQRLYARPIRNMLRRWHDNGMPTVEVSRITGVSVWTLRRIRTGASTTVRRGTVRAILRHKTEIDEMIIYARKGR